MKIVSSTECINVRLNIETRMVYSVVRSHWISTTSISSHLSRVRSRLEAGLNVMYDIRNSSTPTPYVVPDVVPDPSSRISPLPIEGDP